MGSVIVSKPNGSSINHQYHLSGIGQCSADEADWMVPRDREQAIIGNPDVSTRSHKAGFFKDTVGLRGYPIHARCWTLIERVIGARAEERLDVLIRVLRESWCYDDFPELIVGRKREGGRLDEVFASLRVSSNDPVHILAVRYIIDER